MKRSLTPAGLVAVALLGASVAWSLEKDPLDEPAEKKATERQSPMDELLKGDAEFALALYGQLSSSEGNLLFSPYSISQALALVYAGARGETEKQMASVLHFGPQDVVHAAFKSLDEQLRASKHSSLGNTGFKFTIANALWGQKGDVVLASFQKVLRDNYDATLREVNFKGDPEGARTKINDWVAKKTQDKIKDLLSEKAIKKDTSLILTNAIYFLADWQSPFKAEVTRDDDFHLLDGKTTKVPMMGQVHRFAYAKDGMFEAVQLPYKGGGFAMMVLLPESGKFAEAEKSLDEKRLDAIVAKLKDEEVSLTMPKFKYESTFSLAETLAKMGMPEAFDPEHADFSGISGKRDMWIGDVIHKAFVKVDEKGTEAAAATAVVAMRATGLRPANEPIVMTVDRPFIYLIREMKTGTVLFLGRLMDPGQ